MDQAIPSAGLSGTLLVIDLVSYYAAYTLALGIALATRDYRVVSRLCRERSVTFVGGLAGPSR